MLQQAFSQNIDFEVSLSTSSTQKYKDENPLLFKIFSEFRKIDQASTGNQKGDECFLEFRHHSFTEQNKKSDTGFARHAPDEYRDMNGLPFGKCNTYLIILKKTLSGGDITVNTNPTFFFETKEDAILFIRGDVQYEFSNFTSFGELDILVVNISR